MSLISYGPLLTSGVAEQAAVFGGLGESAQVTQAGVDGGGPEGCRRDAVTAIPAAVLVEVVSQPVRQPGAGPMGARGVRPRPDAGQRSANAHARGRSVGQGLLEPVLGQPVPLCITQIPGSARFEERMRQRLSHAEAAGIHRRMNQRSCGGRCVPVPGQQLWRPGQELGHLPILGACGGRVQTGVFGLGEQLSSPAPAVAGNSPEHRHQRPAGTCRCRPAL